MTATQRWKANAELKSFYRTVGDRIRIRRREQALTQANLARSVGLSACVMSNMESGRQRIAAHTLLRIASALDVTVDYLYPLQPR